MKKLIEAMNKYVWIIWVTTSFLWLLTGIGALLTSRGWFAFVDFLAMFAAGLNGLACWLREHE